LTELAPVPAARAALPGLMMARDLLGRRRQKRPAEGPTDCLTRNKQIPADAPGFCWSDVWTRPIAEFGVRFRAAIRGSADLSNL
jgi:hypothetical protein